MSKTSVYPSLFQKNPRRRHKISDPAIITRETLPRLAKRQGHKFNHGHAFIMTGGPGRTGAARLAARGALRIGAGLVTLGTPPAAQMEVASHITAVMLHRVADADALRARLTDTRINALCLGPGLGLSDDRAPLIEAALQSGRPTVLDADALTLIASAPALFALLHAGCVLTPHDGEFARLFPDIAERRAAEPDTEETLSKCNAARAAARRSGAIVLLKGQETVIAAPDGRCALHRATDDRAAPWLATAGAGDVLAGFIAGLMARGFDPMQAAQAATWLHVECARAFGPGLIAEDLPEMLPAVLRGLDA
ncbi:NAD(P)H-hydrate dehydratase [Tateyamaria sp. SN6-1]|uniref:NAD(P)H-hydrate dehydratase n=1 Tax=Tateyamaria sp. SN6-1 TaxID=3092148 RepID=UPI0039F64259